MLTEEEDKLSNEAFLDKIGGICTGGVDDGVKIFMNMKLKAYLTVDTRCFGIPL